MNTFEKGLDELIEKANEIVRATHYQLPHYIKILCIDDSVNDCLLLRGLLSTPGQAVYEVDCVDNADDGIAKIYENKHDIYLIDFKMAPMNGIDLVKRVSKDGKKGPFVIFSGYHNEEFYETALKENIVGFIPKDILTLFSVKTSINHVYTIIDSLIRLSIKNYRIGRAAEEFVLSYNRYKVLK
jgi:YesN/AraC family two-component response regulator